MVTFIFHQLFFLGNYVCVVCRETTEPSPNFIVVYDLQSGTLFKKWKPLCDTVALEISSADGSVVSGLQDARILVWDLITGNYIISKINYCLILNNYIDFFESITSLNLLGRAHFFFVKIGPIVD